MSKVHLRIIGDVHAKYHQYLNIVSGCNHSVQVGDMGFDYTPISHLSNHVFIKGNHDNYDEDCPLALGDYGVNEQHKFYFIRGAFSIDYKNRQGYERATGIKTWWANEQLSQAEMHGAYTSYKSVKPKVMITHSAPESLVKRITNKFILKRFGFDPESFTTNTQLLLQSCLEAHNPKIWIFGHFHKDVAIMHAGTLFICLAELSYLNIDESGWFEVAGKRANFYTGETHE